MADLISFKCSCGNPMKAKAEHAGKKVRCTKCGNLAQIPGGSAAPSAKPAAATPRPVAPAAKPGAPRPAAPAAKAPAPAAKPGAARPPAPSSVVRPGAPRPGDIQPTKGGAADAVALAVKTPTAPPGGMPKCKFHPDRDAFMACTGCMGFLCEECSNTYRGTTFCEDCLQNPERAKTNEAKEAQVALLRDRGQAAGDFSMAFKTTGLFHVIQLALDRVKDDAMLLYFAIVVVMGLGFLTGTVTTLSVRLHSAWIFLGWVVVLAFLCQYLFAGLAGATRDVLFSIRFDIKRFLLHANSGFPRVWPALLVFPLVGLFSAPPLWGEPEGLLTAFLAGVASAFLLMIPLVAFGCVMEAEPLIPSLKMGVKFATETITSVLPINAIVGVALWMWLSTAGGDGYLSSMPFLPDILTGLVVAMLFMIWLSASMVAYLSVFLSKSQVNARVPPAGLPRPERKRTSVAVGVAFVAALACAGAYYAVIGDRAAVRDALRPYNFTHASKYIGDKFSKPAPAPATGKGAPAKPAPGKAAPAKPAPQTPAPKAR